MIAKGEHKEVAEYLCKNGANLDVEGEDGTTAKSLLQELWSNIIEWPEDCKDHIGNNQ